MFRLLPLLLLIACPKAPQRSSTGSVASAGVHDSAFSALLDRHWEHVMRSAPTWATMLGDHRFDDQMPATSVAASAASHQELSAILAAAERLPMSRMRDSDQRYLHLFKQAVQTQVSQEVCAFERWNVSPRHNILQTLIRALEHSPLDKPSDGDAVLARMDAWVRTTEEHIAALRQGLSEGRVANGTSVGLVRDMVQTARERETSAWTFLERAEGSSWEAWRTKATQRIDTGIKPALERYQRFLEDEILPAARNDDAPGLATLPDGAACYEARIQHFTTLPLTADELHARGLTELERIHEEFVAPGAAVFGVWDRALLFERLRTDPTLYFENEAQIVETAQGALARAEAAVPQAFGALPKTACVVKEIPDYEAPYTTIAYYEQPNPDGSKPGEYFVNTYEPTTRPRHEAEVLAFHESVPGHHLQIALSFELPDAPAFHRFGGTTVFVEGWALYTERLADELGLYSGDLDRLGMLSFDAWRAARLVVDTGLHAKGWSREQAVQFMVDNTPLPENNIRNEVDRYITWSAQALAYKTGQLEIRRLRASARDALGEDFDLAGFHDIVLGHGAVDMTLLQQQVDAWVASKR